MTLTQEEYAALAALARRGAVNQDQRVGLDQFLRAIEAREGVARYFLLVQWQELDSSLPPGTRFPDKWPPELRYEIERHDRPIAKADVMAALKLHARKPTEILVTTDTAGVVGWTELDQFPWK